MNRKQRMITAYRQLAVKELDAHMEYSTIFVLAACILAMEKLHAKVNYDKWFKYFAEMYPEVLHDPDPMIKKAQDIAGGDLEIHWTE